MPKGLLTGNWTVTAKGSQGNIYSVNLIIGDEITIIECDCKAGQNNMFCKHRRAVIEGKRSILLYPEDEGGVFNEMTEAISRTTLPEYLKGMDSDIAQLEERKKKIQAQVKERKRKFGEAIKDGIGIA